MYSLLTRHKTLIADIGLFYAAVIWGSTFFIVKMALDDVDPLALVAYRFLLGAVLLLGIMRYRRTPIRTHCAKGWLLGIVYFGLYATQTIGLKFTTASNSGFITGLYLIFVPIMAYWMSRTIPTMAQRCAVGIALMGLWLLTGGVQSVNVGDIITVVSAVGYALHLLLADKYMKRRFDPYAFCFHQFFCAGVLSLACCAIFQRSLAVSSTTTIWIIIFLALFPGVSAIVIQLIAQQWTAPMKVALILIFEPVFAAVFAWTLGGEELIPSRAIGGLLILIAMIVSESPWLKLSKKRQNFVAN